MIDTHANCQRELSEPTLEELFAASEVNIINIKCFHPVSCRKGKFAEHCRQKYCQYYQTFWCWNWNICQQNGWWFTDSLRCQVIISHQTLQNTWWRHKWKHFPRYWPFVRGIFSLSWAWINGWVSNREAGDLRRHRTHYDVTVMKLAVGKGRTPDLRQFRVEECQIM